MASKANIRKKVERLLHTKSGNRCAKCNTILVANATCIGENAHIYGEKPGAARYNASKTIEYVNSEPNLIFLCCNCHKKVDDDEEIFPPEKLFSIKSEHEKRVILALQQGSIDYTYAELEVITSFLILKSGKKMPHQNYQLLHIADKIKKNQLMEVQGYIDMGLLSVARIEEYLNRHPDHNFAERITKIFVEKYSVLKMEEIEPTIIFNELWNFACNYRDDYNYRSAGLALIVYFFEKCEVFEK